MAGHSRAPVNERRNRVTPRPKKKGRAGKIIGTIVLVMVLTAVIFTGIFLTWINTSLKGKTEVYLDELETKVSTELYYQDAKTDEWVMYQTLYSEGENRIWIDLENIPDYMKDAAIAIEDKRFEKHNGVDFRGTVRAILSTLTGRGVQGGSTITQQPGILSEPHLPGTVLLRRRGGGSYLLRQERQRADAGPERQSDRHYQQPQPIRPL